MKNIFKEKKKREHYWDSIPKSELFEACKQFTQVFGGENDKELEDIIKRELLEGNLSIGMIDFIRKGIKEGHNMMMVAQFKDESRQ